MSHFLPLFVKLLTFLVGFELTTRDDLLSIDSNTLPLCHCATGDYGHVLLFVYLYLNLNLIFLILNITVCNLTILCPDIVHIVITY